MFKVRRIEELTPVEWQLLALMSLFKPSLEWVAWREVLRVSCGSPEPTDAEMNLAYRTLAAEGRIRALYGSCLELQMYEHDIAMIRRLAAAAFGEINFDNAFLLVRHAALASNRSSKAFPEKPLEDDRLRQLEYYSDLNLKERFAESLDAFVEETGNIPASWRDDQDAPYSNWSLTPPPLTDELRLPLDLEQALLEGKPVGDRLDRIVAAAEAHATLRSKTFARLIAALFVWAGRGDLLECYAALTVNGNSLEEATAFARGFFGEGWRRMPTGAVDIFHEGSMAERTLIAFLAARFAKAPSRLCEAIANIRRYYDESSLAPLWKGVESAMMGGRTTVPNKAETPLGWLGVTIAHALSERPAVRTNFKGVQEALDFAITAAQAGWLFLAAQMGGLLAQYPEVSESALTLSKLAPGDEPLLWLRTEVAQPWDAILDDLVSALTPFVEAKGKAAPKKRKTGKILSAILEMESLPINEPSFHDGDEAFSLQEIDFALLRKSQVSDPPPIKPCTWRALKKALADDELELPSASAAALSKWVASVRKYGGEGDLASALGDERALLLDILLDAGNALVWSVIAGSYFNLQEWYVDKYGIGYKDRDYDGPKPVPIAAEDIEVRDIELDTESRPDGSLLMRMPRLAWEATDNPLIVKSEGRYIWWRVTPPLKAVLNVIDGYSGRQTREVTIPAGGAEKARAILTEAAKAGLPVHGAVTAVGDGNSLPRVAGGAGLVARLDRREEALRLSLRSRPSPEVRDLLFPPGRGRAEVAVSRPESPFILVRDIKAETAAADIVRTALADFEGEREGESEWATEDPARELAMLDALHAAVAASNGGLEAEWRAQPSERTMLRAVKNGRLKGGRDGNWWLELQGDFELDDGSRVALRELLEALPLRVGGYIPLGGRAWLKLSATLKKRLEALAAAATVEKDEVHVSRAALPMLGDAFNDDGDGEGLGDAPQLPESIVGAAAKISAGLAANHDVPEGLAARLRPYQLEGFEWLARLAACGLGSCLADDMGLGKTVQLLALLLERADEGPSLVVAPASVCGNWCAEAGRFAPSLRVVRAADSATLPEKLGPRDLVVTSYGLLTSRTEQFEAVQWNGAILDEAQAIKNAETHRAESAKRLRSSWRCVATGTPVENRLSDLWSLFDFLNPGLLGSLPSFRRRFLDKAGRPTPALRTLVRPLILRRVKGEVLHDLPPKTEITLAVEPHDAERAAYESLREKAFDEFESGAKGARMKILAALTRLRRFCCSPSLVVAGAGTGAKLEALESLLAELRDNGHRALIFSQFTDVLALVKPILERNGWGYEYLDGSTPQKERMRCVEDFQRGVAPFFLVSLKAGGTGLNLTAASYVVLLDPWWNPAVENQAADRAHRIGQRNPVTVYRLVMKGTIEEKVLELHGEKRMLSDAVLDGTSDAALSEEDLLAILNGK